jgi:hypothetical protein
MIKKLPLHTFLLPVYFVCSKYVQYEGLPGGEAAIISCIQLLLLTSAVYLIFRFFISNRQKTALLSSATMFILLFFGDIRVFLKGQAAIFFLSQYKFFLPLLAILFYLFIRSIRKEPAQLRTTFFFNTIVLLVLLLEGIKLISLHNSLQQKNQASQITLSDSVSKGLPDIYYIVADCYPSSQYQQEVLGINNGYFEDSLTTDGFFIPAKSQSNYNRTVFSMLSTFEMDYLRMVDTVNLANPKSHALAIRDMKSPLLFRHLEKAGYNIANLSIFDIGKTKALRKQNFLAASPKGIFFSHTLWNYFLRDIYHTWIFKNREYKQQINRKIYEPLKAYNRQIEDTLLNSNFSDHSNPVFVYAHLNMPHYPYFFNEKGIPNTADSIYGKEMITNRSRFAGYIRYTNTKLLQILRSIKDKTKGSAVIILQSDHGINDLSPAQKTDAFRNFTAFYFPDRNYSTVPDTMSNVNTFRIVLNKLMDQRFNNLADHTYYIKLR